MEYDEYNFAEERSCIQMEDNLKQGPLINGVGFVLAVLGSLFLSLYMSI